MAKFICNASTDEVLAAEKQKLDELIKSAQERAVFLKKQSENFVEEISKSKEAIWKSIKDRLLEKNLITADEKVSLGFSTEGDAFYAKTDKEISMERLMEKLPPGLLEALGK